MLDIEFAIMYVIIYGYNMQPRFHKLATARNFSLHYKC